MKIMKFGGSSVADAERIKSVIEIVCQKNQEEPVAVVLSAMKGTTDLLIKSARLAEAGDLAYKKSFKEIEEKHLKAIEGLFESNKTEILHQINRMLLELSEILHGIELVKECSIRSLDLIMSFGERLSCTLTSHYMRSIDVAAEMLDSRKLVVTDDQFGSAVVQFEKSYQKISARMALVEGIPVITGFLASTENGITTTLGRNGSDYTASIIGAGIKASCIEIWTDVDGVLSADPRCVDDTFVIPELSYQEAMELSYFGAEVIHPYTMVPAVDRVIPIWIKNTLNPVAKGTLIARDIKRHAAFITGIACIDDVSILNVEGGGMLKSPGIAAKIFTTLAEEDINIIMISQASSEHTVCIVLQKEDAQRAHQALTVSLEAEISNKQIQSLELNRELVVISVIGENMRGTPGICGKLFSTLGENDINIFAIAQGSSERNISFVTQVKNKNKALNALHVAFLKK